MTDLFTTADAAAALGVSEWKVRQLARACRVGYNVRGRSGWRFSPVEVERMRDSMRPDPLPARRRKRRTA